MLPGQAFDLLTITPRHTREELIEQVSAISAEDIHLTAAEAMGAGLLMVPHGIRADWAGFTAAPTTSNDRATGRTHASLERTDSRLVVGDQAVSWIQDEQVSTVRYDACAAIRAWPDGARQLFGSDGTIVGVEPTLLADGAHAVARIDAAAPPTKVLLMPARDPEQIPKPDPQGPRKPHVPPGRLGRWERAFLVPGFLLAILLGPSAGFLTYQLLTNDFDDASSGWVFTIALWIVALVRIRKCCDGCVGVHRCCGG